MKELIALNEMAVIFFDRAEYAVFIDLMEKLRNRSSDYAKKTTPEEIKTEKKYSYDIEVKTEFITYKNNHKGERIELFDFDINEILVKIPLGKDPKNKINDLKNSIKLASEIEK
jgi:hypothetical protein